MIIWTQHTGDSFVEPPVLFLCTLYIVPCTLFDFLASEGVDLVPAEDEDLAVTEEFGRLF